MKTRSPLRTGDLAWIVLAGAIVAYEIYAPRGELLSQAVDRYLEAHPLLTTALVSYTAAHLLNLLPEELDVFHWLAVWGKKSDS